jgi:signal transduction histidine kinase
VRFDDRLKTVLDTPVADDRDRAVRWRQLIDLLSRARPDADPGLVARALDLAEDDRVTVPDEVRAATARSIAGRPLDPRLVAFFAADRIEVAAPLLASTTLDSETRARVAAVASDDVRRLFFALEGTALPPPPETPTLELTEVEPIPSIGEVVARIERIRRQRDAETPSSDSIVAPSVADLALFRWESDSAGAVAWVEGAPRGALIGRTLVGHSGEALLAPEGAALLARRAPFVDIPFGGGEPFAGDWRVSGAPAFSPGEGRFIGYRGIARRLDAAPVAARATHGPLAAGGASNVDSLRELVHDIKTTLNSIIGFAEIIDGQYLGPAHRNYRERASGIVAQARSLLAAIEDLDLAAKLQIGQAAGGGGTDLAEMFSGLAEQLNAHGAARGLEIAYRLEGRVQRSAMAPEVAERLVRRFVTAIIDSAGNGETVQITVAPLRGQCMVSVARPPRLRATPDSELLDPSFAAPGEEGQLGLGFALRLVRGLVRLGGGDLIIDPASFMLVLPAQR